MLALQFPWAGFWQTTIHESLVTLRLPPAMRPLPARCCRRRCGWFPDVIGPVFIYTLKWVYSFQQRHSACGCISAMIRSAACRAQLGKLWPAKAVTELKVQPLRPKKNNERSALASARSGFSFYLPACQTCPPAALTVTSTFWIYRFGGFSRIFAFSTAVRVCRRPCRTPPSTWRRCSTTGRRRSSSSTAKRPTTCTYVTTWRSRSTTAIWRQVSDTQKKGVHVSIPAFPRRFPNSYRFPSR